MIVEGTCRTCTKQFDAHWHNYQQDGVTVSPYCPYCKSPDMQTQTDEINYADEMSNFEEEE